MVHLSIRNIQAANMIFSSWALVFLAIGIIIEEWAELTFEPKQHKLIHNPWICCNPIWPEGQSCSLERDRQFPSFLEREGSSFLDFIPLIIIL